MAVERLLGREPVRRRPGGHASLVESTPIARLSIAAFVAVLISASAEARTTCQTHACEARVKANQWRHQQAKLSPETKQMLVRLRGCETRGIAFPHNYRYSGHHFGAYQYTWGSGSAGDRAGFHVRPDQASPAEQDVRTARFYPQHRSEWACRA